MRESSSMDTNEEKRDGYAIHPSSVGFASYQQGYSSHRSSFTTPFVLSACDDEKGVPEHTLVVPGNRISQKRDSDVEIALVPPVKRGFPTDVIIDALLQTTIPEVPDSRNSSPEDTTAGEFTNSLTPTLDYFSNEIIFYNNGVLERQTNPLSPPSLVNLEEVESDMDASTVDFTSEEEPSDVDGIFEVQWNDEDDERATTSECLKDYVCPVCYESPVSPVSTICGHVFCRKCMKRLFMSDCLKWKCPQCRHCLSPSDFHPLYLP